MAYHFFDPTRVLFGCGRLNELHSQNLPGKKAMIVISNGKSTRANGYLDRVIRELEKAGVESVVFDKVSANPLKATVEEGAKFAADNGCDFVVALGGGSVMDASKVMAMFATQPGDDLWDYAAGATGRQKPIVNAPLPVVAITTTAGTGSEVDHWGVVTNPETNEKIAVGSYDSMFPVLSIVDPELMASVPPKFTAYQGFDALFHSMEGYTSKTSNIMGDMIQRTAIELCGKYLARAVKDGSDMEAREGMAFANTLGGYSMVVGSCNSEHAIEHAMSAYHGELPHGAGLIMISIEYYKMLIESHTADQRCVDMARFLGRTDAKEPMELITALEDLQKACGVDNLKMSDYGITPDEFLKMAQNARGTMAGLFACDLFDTTDEDIVGLYQRSYR